MSQEQTTLQCQCGRKYDVPVTIIVKSDSELERELEQTRQELRALRYQLRRLSG